MIRKSILSRHRRQLLLGDTQEASAVYSSFVSANATPDADGTNTNLTFTLKDTDDVAMTGRSVTYA